MINIFKLNEVEVIFSYNIVQQISDLTTNLESILIYQKYFKPKFENNINSDINLNQFPLSVYVPILRISICIARHIVMIQKYLKIFQQFE